MIRQNGDGVPVVALDIDGTLGDYHGHFLRFASSWLGREMPSPDAINPGMRLHRFMGVPLREYRECKLAYRSGGLKRSMPAYPGAAELTASIQSQKAQVWICTTRPYLRLDNIDPDTREWLRRNGIRYDAVLFGDEKYRELKRQAGNRVAAVLEDLPELWNEARRRFPWSTVLLRDQPYNRHVGTYARVHDLNEACTRVSSAINEWRASRAVNDAQERHDPRGNVRDRARRQPPPA